MVRSLLPLPNLAEPQASASAAASASALWLQPAFQGASISLFMEELPIPWLSKIAVHCEELYTGSSMRGVANPHLACRSPDCLKGWGQYYKLAIPATIMVRPSTFTGHSCDSSSMPF